jgi:predicted NAD/FAD-binding protein/cyclopropane fatty-acyl-phospholipid synthase-like methyltransferase/DUF1365 family protein
VDIGFQVFNLTTYPHLVAFFRELKVDTEESDMSFSNSSGSWEWSSNGLSTIFPEWGSCMDVEHVKMVRDIFRFGSHAPKVLEDPKYKRMTMQQYLHEQGYSTRFMTCYIGPMLSAIWSVPGTSALEMPIQTVVQFYINHHLLSTVTPRPTWRVVKGRSKNYVDAVLEALPNVKSGTEIVSVKRTDDGVVLEDSNQQLYSHDRVVFATHAPDTLRMLGEDATPEELEILGAVKYQDNLCVLHDDASYMPKNKKVWSAWNFIGEWQGPNATGSVSSAQGSERSVCCTYYLNRLQNLPEDTPHRFVTLNPHIPVPKTAVLGQWTLAHPVLNAEAVEAQEKLPSIQGQKRTWFCGAWTRYGFHEDGILSAVTVAESMGVSTPWKITHSPDPVPSAFGFVAAQVFHNFMKACIKTGQMRVIYPDGTEQSYGPPESSLKAILRVMDYRFFSQILAGSDIALGEAFMADMFDTDTDTARLCDVIIANQNNFAEYLWMLGPVNYCADTWNWLQHLLLVRNTVQLSAANIEAHYDQGNDMFRTFMDETMMYSSAIHWDNDAEEQEWLWGSKRDAELRTDEGDELYNSQLRKLDTILAAADIKPGATVLEIGCGWGECAIRGVMNYKCNWVGLTLSKEQKAEADARIKRLGLEHCIKILVCDYRNIFDHHPPGSFDCIVSIEMMEAIGHQNFGKFFWTTQRALKPGGKLMVQVITIPHERYDAYCKSSDFIRKHIFPGGHLPSVTVLDEFSRANDLALVHCKDIGPHYAVTLKEWCKRFTEQQDKVLELGYSREFFRKFVWYFSICEASFRAKMIGNHHLCWVKGMRPQESIGMAPRSLMTRMKQAIVGGERTTPLVSGLYTGVVYHSRRKVAGVSNAENSFEYKVMMAHLDLAELDQVFAGSWLWGVDRPALVSFNRKDHVGPPGVPLDLVIRDLVQKETTRRPQGRITVLTQLRFMGYCFNPITVYYCWSECGTAVETMVLHVTNTPWQEDICYVLPTQGKVNDKKEFVTTFNKQLHVSPFLDMDYQYKLVAAPPGSTIQLSLENHRKSSPDAHSDEASTAAPFFASVNLHRQEITTRNLMLFLLTVPLMTWQVQFWIHWQALILFLKKATVFEVDHPKYNFHGSTNLQYLFDLVKHIVLFIGAILWMAPAKVLKTLGVSV